MTKAVLLIGLTMFTLTLMGACQIKSHSNVEIQESASLKKQHVKVQEDARELIDVFPWEQAYDQSKLIKEIDQQIKLWSDTQHALDFRISTTKRASEYEGVYRSPVDWKLQGVMKKDQVFTLEHKGDRVTLKLNQQEKKLNPEEFVFLIPLPHLTVIKEILISSQFESVVWKKDENGWQVILRAPISSIKDPFHHFLSTHLSSEVERLDQFELQRYTITYRFYLASINNELNLNTFQFFLNKDAMPIETVQFHF